MFSFSNCSVSVPQILWQTAYVHVLGHLKSSLLNNGNVAAVMVDYMSVQKRRSIYPTKTCKFSGANFTFVVQLTEKGPGIANY